MNDHPLLADAERRVAALRDELARIAAVPAAGQTILRLDQALARQRGQRMDRPLFALLLGGTGVGKSALFNALVGSPDASPSSDGVRCFTQQAFVAVHPDDRPLLELPPDLTSTLVDGRTPGVILADTPDIDGILERNRYQTQRLVEIADLVILVASPDKRANDAVIEQLRLWAPRKRWLFVMTKRDLYPAEAETIRNNYTDLLRGRGFDLKPNDLFFLSTTQPEIGDLAKLRDAFWQARSPEQLLFLRSEGFLRYAEHAFDGDPAATFQSLATKLDEAEAGLAVRLQMAYADALKKPETADAFKLVVRQAAWRQAAESVGPLARWPVLLRNRFGTLLAGYSVNRLFMRGLSLGGVLGAGATTLFAAAGGMLPLRRIVESLGIPFRQTMDAVKRSSKRVLEDYRLDGLVPAEIVETKPAMPEVPQVGIPGVGPLIEKGYNYLFLRDIDAEVMAQLSRDVDRAGIKIAKEATGGFGSWLVLCFANLLPLGMIGWVLYRIGNAWWTEYYLNLPFYLMSIALILAAFLIGFIPIWLRVSRRAAAYKPGESVALVEQPPATESLRHAAGWLHDRADECERVKRTLKETRETLAREGRLDAGNVGHAV